MIEDYVRWLSELHAARTRVRPADADEIQAAVRVLRRHAARLPREEDFVSLAAEEMAGRLRGEPAGTEALPPFLTLLDRSADAVRHRILREVRKRPGLIRGDVAERHVTPTVLARLLATELTLEEAVVIQAMLAGDKPAEVASRLGISPRTVYRRIEQIRQRLDEEEA